MAHITINQYLQQVYEAIDTRDGASCAELVSFKHPHVANPRLQLASPEEKCQQVLEPPYDEMFAAHLRCTYAVGNHDFIEAYKCQTVIVQSFLRAFQAHKEDNWALPVMYAVALDLRIFANNADQQLVKKGRSKVGDMLEKAAELLMSCFRVCASDTRAGIEDSKKWGMLFLVNQLFKIYFKINKLHLCKPLIRAIDSSNLKDDYSTAQRVTFRYYVGRKAMFDSDFKQGLFFFVSRVLKMRGCGRRQQFWHLISIRGVPVLCLRALPPLESEEQTDDSHLFAPSENAAGSYADHRAVEKVSPHAVCRSDQSCQRRQSSAVERGSDEARDLLYPLWHFPYP
ncbi:PCI domain-containing protein 2 isoform X4 [Lynx rufus]|uniref:PCI domain-containing protein 2 isoform X4 n=1 Tax=Lynx rufus TaxID=61384 RepID=UPI001F123072|nr:PCI domain-containing protein 2 isoform X4 [Lynx rufus]